MAMKIETVYAALDSLLDYAKDCGCLLYTSAAKAAAAPFMNGDSASPRRRPASGAPCAGGGLAQRQNQEGIRWKKPYCSG